MCFIFERFEMCVQYMYIFFRKVCVLKVAGLVSFMFCLLKFFYMQSVFK